MIIQLLMQNKETNQDKIMNEITIEQLVEQKITAIKDIKADKEICGVWIWVTFSGIPSKEVRDQLKSEGFRYAFKKKKWYFAGKKCGYSKGMKMDEIRFSHGSRKA